MSSTILTVGTFNTLRCEMIIGTNHFTSTNAAYRYYRDYGYDRAAVKAKFARGEIVAGPPELKDGEKLSVIDNGTRYAVTTAN